MATFPSKVNYATGDVLTATNMNDVGGAINLLESAQYAAGKNKVINGNFDVWQRGTSFSTTDTYTSDRWKTYLASAGTVTRDSTLIPTGSSYGLRITSGSAGFTGGIAQSIETLNALPFAGKTVTLSAYIAGTVGKTASIQIAYSTSDNVAPFGSWTVLTTSSVLTVSGTFQRLTVTGTLPSTARSIRVYCGTDGTLANTEYLTFGQVQLEAASTASPFQTASGSIAGELALCQRYCYVIQGNTTNASSLGTGYWNGTTNVVSFLTSKSQMRATPTLIYSQASDLEALQVGISWNAVSAVALGAEANAYTAQFGVTTTGGTSGQAANVRLKALSTAYIGLVAEL